MDKQTLLADLERVALKCPRQRMTRELYRKHGKHSCCRFTEAFRSWNGALKAAGLQLNHEVICAPRRKACLHVMALGDIHFPFENQIVINKIFDDVEAKQPDVIIQLGDLYDLYSFAKFPRSFNLYTPDRELDLARSKAERFWREIKKRAPKAMLYQLWGNHDDRAVKRILEKSPEHLHFVQDGMQKLMTFDGVTTIIDSRDELVIDNVWYFHGYLSHLGAHARANAKRVVCAHSHLGGAVYIKLEHEIIWELNAGWIGNRHALACSYAAQRRMSKWTNGYGEVDEFGPRFIPIFAEASR